MAEQALASLIQLQREKVAQSAAAALVKHSESAYASLSEKQLVLQILPTLDALAQYFMTNDIEAYKTYIIRVGKERRDIGFSMKDVGLSVEIIVEKLYEAIDQSLPGAENESTRIRFHRRIQSLQLVSQLSAIRPLLIKDS